MRKDDANRLRHMRDAGREALEFARSRARSDLDTDRMLVLALIKDIEIIGEAANQVSEETRTQFPDIPWADIDAIRQLMAPPDRKRRGIGFLVKEKAAKYGAGGKRRMSPF